MIKVFKSIKFFGVL